MLREVDLEKGFNGPHAIRGQFLFVRIYYDIMVQVAHVVERRYLMDKVDISKGIESLDIGRENIFCRFGKLSGHNHHGRMKSGLQAVKIVRMKGDLLLRLACQMKCRIYMLHLLDGLVKVIDDHHDHFLFFRLFFSFV